MKILIVNHNLVMMDEDIEKHDYIFIYSKKTRSLHFVSDNKAHATLKIELLVLILNQSGFQVKTKGIINDAFHREILIFHLDNQSVFRLELSLNNNYFSFETMKDLNKGEKDE